MRPKTFALAAIAAACLTLARPGAAGTRADELQLSIVEAQTSGMPSPRVTVQWAPPQSNAANFQSYELMRGKLIPMSAMSLAGLAALGTGLFVAGWGLRTRRRGLAGGGFALALALPLGLQALAFIDFQPLTPPTPILDIGTTSYTDTDVQAGQGFFYKVVAHFSDSSTQTSPAVYGAALDPAAVPESDLLVRFEQGPDPNSITPEDGVILEPNTPSVSVSGCIAATAAGCSGVQERGTPPTGHLFLNEVQAGGDRTGSFAQPLTLSQGPNFVQVTGSNSAGKSITLARTYSLGELRLSGELIPKAIGVVVSPRPATGPSLITKLKNQFNQQTTADWNDLLGRLDYPRVIHIQNASATLDMRITNIRLGAGGDIVANRLELGQQSPNKAIFSVALSLQNLNIDYTLFDATLRLPAPFSDVNTCPRGPGAGRIHFGNVQLRATFTLSLENGKLFLSLTQLSGPVIQDDAGDFDTQKLIGGPECRLALDLDAQLLTAISDQATAVFNHIELGSASVEDVPLGQSGLKLDLAIAELSQDPNSTGLVIRFDAGVQTSQNQVAFPLTNNAPPDSRTGTGGTFPGAFTSAADAGFSLADDLINESLAAAQSAGLLTGAIEVRLKTGATTSVPLSVAGLDPAPHTADALLPNLHLHAPPEAPVRIAISYTTNPVAGLRTSAVRAQGGLQLLQTGLVADVLVDADRNGIFEAATEKALTLDLDVLSTSDVELMDGALHFLPTTPVRGYTATPGFMSVPHAGLKRLADAIIDDRINRLLEVLNGVGGAGLVIPGLTFTTLESVADGPTAAPYKDALTAWGATDIDLKELLDALLDRINPASP
jgi:hypothetical protein